jgi:hypothetical protein
VEAITPVGATEGGAVGTDKLAVPALILAPVSGKDRVMVNDAANDSAGINPVAAVQTDAEGLRADYPLK